MKSFGLNIFFRPVMIFFKRIIAIITRFVPIGNCLNSYCGCTRQKEELGPRGPSGDVQIAKQFASDIEQSSMLKPGGFLRDEEAQNVGTRARASGPTRMEQTEGLRQTWVHFRRNGPTRTVNREAVGGFSPAGEIVGPLSEAKWAHEESNPESSARQADVLPFDYRPLM